LTGFILDTNLIAGITAVLLESGWFLLSVIPVVCYKNADALKKEVVRDNRRKSGVYRWINNINGKEYVGSSTDLLSRFYSYYSLKYLEQQSTSLICKALLKYGHSAFTLEILEYCRADELVVREQFYLDLLDPEYNILKHAYSLLGFKHSEENLAKFKLKKISLEHKNILSLVHSNKEVSEETSLPGEAGLRPADHRGGQPPLG